MASHLDSVEKGGRFDGVLGILLTAIEAIRTLKENDIELEIPLMLVNFTNEEGARLDPAMMSSVWLCFFFFFFLKIFVVYWLQRIAQNSNCGCTPSGYGFCLSIGLV